MKKAYVFPGQGAQFPGMGKQLYESSAKARHLFDSANQILGFDIKSIMFEGSAQDLTQTKVTQPAVFLHSVAVAFSLEDFSPDMVAGHSLGEFSALVAAEALSFEDGLRLVAIRAQAMQEACEQNPSTMAAILGLEEEKIEKICAEIEAVVVPANYNCPGQLVISGSKEGIELAIVKLKEAGAKRALPLQVGGAFHSPLMAPARQRLSFAIEATEFAKPRCPIFQNVDAKPHSTPEEIKANLVAQLTAPVLWSQSVLAMVDAGATEFVECGPGTVLQGLVKKISPQVQASSIA
jgi:[acyl-carrier-protein] S-malonyltransferase